MVVEGRVCFRIGSCARPPHLVARRRRKSRETLIFLGSTEIREQLEQAHTTRSYTDRIGISDKPRDTTNPTAGLSKERALELSHFDPDLPFHDDDETRIVFTSALVEPNPDPDNPDHVRPYNKKYELLTYHKVPLHRSHPLLYSVGNEGPAEDLGALQVNRVFNSILPALPNVSIYFIIKYNVVETDMHRVLKGVEQLEGFLGSRLPLEWRDLPFCKDRESGKHKIFFDPTEGTGGVPFGMVMLM